VPVPEPFGTVLDDETDRADLDVAFSWLRSESSSLAANTWVILIEIRR